VHFFTGGTNDTPSPPPPALSIVNLTFDPRLESRPSSCYTPSLWWGDVFRGKRSAPQAPHEGVPLTVVPSRLPNAPTSIQMVSVSHPVGAFLIHAVQAHTSKTGDGTVAMLAMITGGLQKVTPRRDRANPPP